MFVNTLIIEVGRLCNMNCRHCLRGNAEDKTIKIEDAKYVIDQFDEIGNITFTGGEPMLYADCICEIIDYIMEKNVSVDSFYIATNGKFFDQKLVMKLAEFYGYIIDTYGDDGENYSQLDVSTDQYHEYVEIPGWVKAFSFYSHRSNIPKGGLINEGRAKDNHIGCRKSYADTCFDFDESYVDMFYLNAEGYFYPNCDLSYQTQRDLQQFGIKDLKGGMTLEEIFEKYKGIEEELKSA